MEAKSKIACYIVFVIITVSIDFVYVIVVKFHGGHSKDKKRQALSINQLYRSLECTS